MITLCVTRYIQNGNTWGKKKAYINIINPASIKDKFPTGNYSLDSCLALILCISTTQLPVISPIGIF